MYPDIDEVVHYPWQGNQSTEPQASPSASGLDPSLYRGLFPGSSSQVPDRPNLDDDDDNYGYDESSFENSEEEFDELTDNNDDSDMSYQGQSR